MGLDRSLGVRVVLRARFYITKPRSTSQNNGPDGPARMARDTYLITANGPSRQVTGTPGWPTEDDNAWRPHAWHHWRLVDESLSKFADDSPATGAQDERAAGAQGKGRAGGARD